MEETRKESEVRTATAFTILRGGRLSAQYVCCSQREFEKTEDIDFFREVDVPSFVPPIPSQLFLAAIASVLRFVRVGGCNTSDARPRPAAHIQIFLFARGSGWHHSEQRATLHDIDPIHQVFEGGAVILPTQSKYR